MNNFKRTLAVITAFAMIFSMGMITTFAYSDVEDGSTVSEAVGILSNLGIFDGFEDGTFRPDDTVTRAQMAAVICRMLGYEDQARGNGGTTAFNDVSSDHWAAGYINVAHQLGIINGFGDDTFRPEEDVTYEQAVKMIVCALGYNLAAQSKGGYPTGYLSIASSEGITKNSKGAVGEPAKRSTIAMLVYNSLEVRLFDQTSWTTNGSDEYAKTDDTVLSKYLEVRRWEGVVTSVPFTDYADDGYSNGDTPYITIDGFYKEYLNGREEKYEDDSPKRADCSLVNADGLLGKRVVAYIGDSEDDSTGRIMVYALSEKTNANKITTIAGTQLVDSNDKEWTQRGQISYRNVGSSKVYDLDLNDDVEFFVNYSHDGSYDENTTSEEVASLVEDGGRIEFISNNNDDDIDYVIVNAYNYEGVIKDISEDDGLYSFSLYKGELDDIDTEDDDTFTLIYIDGEIADVDDLDDGDTVSSVEINGSDVRLLYVSTDSVTGEISGYDADDDTVYIDGVDYALSPFLGKSAKNLKDEEGVFYLNVDGQISHSESSSTSSGNYAFVLAVGHDGGITENYVVQLALSDGTVAEYDLSSKVKFYAQNGNISATNDDAVAAKLALMADGTPDVTVSTAYTTVSTAVDMLFNVTIKNGVVTKIKTLEGDSYDNYLTANTKKYDSESMSYGSAEFDSDTVVFSLDYSYSSASTTRLDKSELSIGKVSKFFSDGEDGYTFMALDEDSGVFGAVIGFSLATSVPESGDAVIISSIRNVSYDSDDAIQITGLRGGREVTYTIYDENNSFSWNDSPDSLSKGDVILVSSEDSDGVVSDFKLLYTASKTGMGTVSARALAGNVSYDIYNAAGLLSKDKTTSSKFYINTDVKNSGGTFSEKNDGITMKSSANYTLVDYTESTKNPTISKKNPGTSLFSSSSKYDSFVFVRVYDDVLSDVVVYRFANEDSVVETLSKPTFTENEVNSTLTISAASGAKIYYTTDGSTPTEASNAYTEAIALTEPVTITAFAVKSGYISSPTNSYEHTVKLPNPVITISQDKTSASLGYDASVSEAIKSAAKFYYTTDGTEPSKTNGSLYTNSAIAISSGMNVKAIAVSDVEGYESSSVSESGAITLSSLSAPQITINGANATITSANEDATIYYTTDGTTPTTASSVYDGSAIPLTGSITIQAMAYKAGYVTSSVKKETYTPQVKTPKITITGSTLAITCATDDAKIYYTTNGTTPTNASTLYTAETTLTEPSKIKAIAIKDGFDDSNIDEEDYAPQVKTPNITITGSTLAITCATDNAKIYYTTNGTTPTSASTLYTAETTLTEPSKIKAIAIKDGFEDSSIDEEDYAPQVKTPNITITGSTLAITCATDNAKIYFTTNGTTPTSASTLYSAEITLSEPSTIKAIAIKEGFDDSSIDEEVYAPQVKAPKITISDAKIAITCTTDDAKIYFTTNGSKPTSDSQLYLSEFTLTDATTIKAIAVKTGFEASDVEEKAYKPKIDTPKISISGSTVSISCATEGAVIHYTTDGKEPTASAAEYDGKAITLTESATVKAIAVKTGWEDSEVNSKAYTTIVKAPKIKITGTSLSFTCATDGADLYYTLDGKQPTKSASKYDGKPITLTEAKTIKVFAAKEGYEDSEVVTEQYKPVVSEPKIKITDGIAEISTATDKADIFYTLDGKTPTKASTPYVKPFLLSGTGVLKAIAIKTGFEDSEVNSESYTIAVKPAVTASDTVQTK